MRVLQGKIFQQHLGRAPRPTACEAEQTSPFSKQNMSVKLNFFGCKLSFFSSNKRLHRSSWQRCCLGALWLYSTHAEAQSSVLLTAPYNMGEQQRVGAKNSARMWKLCGCPDVLPHHCVTWVQPGCHWAVMLSAPPAAAAS